ncbi:MAG: hypothetical protein AAGI71_16230 [Bacteroidota bacterium]
MPAPSPSRPSAEGPERPVLTRALWGLGLGFFGGLLAIWTVPRMLRFASKRFAVGFVREVAAITLTGLLTDALVDRLTRSAEPDAPPPHR